MATPKEHIEEIRRKKFSIGGEENPLIGDLHQTVKLLSAELYTKDVHFLMELIQNAEDNEYDEGVDPSLEFVITSRDITGVGAPITLLIFNNEKGFSAKNIESICSAGRSTKKGNRKQGFIGEKGIGFKSVFLITTKPHIFSNGYQIMFNEDPCPYCNLGYIVPEWVEEKPSLSDIKQIYGSSSSLPTTILLLPLKPDKVKAVKQELSSVHPEVILFLSKIKRFSVREDNEDPRLNTVNSIAINSEIDFVSRKSIDAESYTIILSGNDDNIDDECSYYMWKQKFAVKLENRVERRMEAEELVITLAFPYGMHLQRAKTSPRIYSFLPTEMCTNFPFIIQADFLLSSSRETILLDNKWNMGILDCVPTAFVNALVSLVRMTENAPVSSLTWMFNFLPVNRSSYEQLNAVRDSIRARLVEENIMPSESYLEQKFFLKPRDVGRLMPAFWNILQKAKDENEPVKNLSSHGVYVLNSAFDKEEYDEILNFLGVGHVNNEWYAKCIQSSNLVLGVSEDVYLELLLFIAENWSSKFHNTNMINVRLIKYADVDGNVALNSINECSYRKVCTSYHNSWLNDWNREFRCVANHFFLPESTHDAIQYFSRKETLFKWLREVANVYNWTVNDYAALLIKHLGNDRKLLVAYTHFLCHSLAKNNLLSVDVQNFCRSMPLVDNYGNIITTRNGILVPASGSKWAELLGSNPWGKQGYIELGEDYLKHNLFTRSSKEDLFLVFLRSHVGASDIPDICPPNSGIPAVSNPLTQKNVFVLLDWIKTMKYRGIGFPAIFLRSIKEGSWLRVTFNGSFGYNSPSQSFFLTSSLGEILQNGSDLVDIPLVDEGFYGERINNYKEELETVGVMFEYVKACAFIGNRLMSLASSSSLSRGHMFSILNFIRFLRENCLSLHDFINSIKEGRWLKTSYGYRSPVGSVLFDPEWDTASQISNIPFIDQDYYGEQLPLFKEELRLLGVAIGVNENYHEIVIENLKLSSDLSYLTADALSLVMACICCSKSSQKLIKVLKDAKCLMTNLGYKSPCECFLLDPEWGCLLNVLNEFPLIDQSFYGNTVSLWKLELKKLGVVVDFEAAATAFAQRFKHRTASSFSKDDVLLFLACYRKLKEMSLVFPPYFMNIICESKWLRTRLGDYRIPRECILFGPDWESISPIAVLPFIDDGDSHYGNAIYEYRIELESLGVVVEFQHGAKIIASSLCFFPDPVNIKPESVFALLKCIRTLLDQGIELPESFFKKVCREWLRTYAGYRSPDECVLFDSNWESYLKLTDGPFVDEEFYGPEIKSYRKELGAMGVTVVVQQGCPLLARYLKCHSDFETIVRIYNFLGQLKWKEGDAAAKRIWVPDGRDNGNWVHPKECVLHDEDGLLTSELNVLEKHYSHKLLDFFSSAFSVKSYPSVDDYCKIWKNWESSKEFLSNYECCGFWGFVMRHWGSKTEKVLRDNMVRLPVEPGSDVILLRDKGDVFIADDLQLKDVFNKSSNPHLFVWYPQPSLLGLPRTTLFEIYRTIGVCKISEYVRKEELSLENGEDLKMASFRNDIGKVLIKLILGFLADPRFNLEAEKRHDAVGCLLKLTVFETSEPISMRYSLKLSSGDVVKVNISQVIRWDKESSTLLAQKMNISGIKKNMIKYATYFSEVISKGILWDRQEHINELYELIKQACLLEFDEEAVQFLMMSKNLQIFMEDEKFLSTVFPSE